MSYGLQIWDSSGNSTRLDVGDRQVKAHSFYQGVFPAGVGLQQSLVLQVLI